ncbi:MAG: hypothetical protein ACREWE_14300 [Gammaproteobacteria bacterium]
MPKRSLQRVPVKITVIDRRNYHRDPHPPAHPLAFERAECGSDPSVQRRLLTFVIVGGGPTGVELAGPSRNWHPGPLAPTSATSTRRAPASSCARPRSALYEYDEEAFRLFEEDL